MSPLLSPQQAAEQLGISARTLHEFVRKGLISYIAIGLGMKRRRKMFDPEDLHRFRERHRRTECPSTKDPVRKPGPTISGSEVIDFQALREQRRAARQNARKLGLERSPAPN